jgi:hypothetical protein
VNRRCTDPIIPIGLWLRCLYYRHLSQLRREKIQDWRCCLQMHQGWNTRAFDVSGTGSSSPYICFGEVLEWM